MRHNPNLTYRDRHAPMTGHALAYEERRRHFTPECGGEYYDRLEVREPERRLLEFFTALPGLLHHAQDNAPALAEHLHGLDLDNITSLDALSRVPVLRKSELLRRQASAYPFGGLSATPLTRLTRVFASPGPIYQPEGSRPDYWRFARALFAAGIRSGDLVYNTFSYHLNAAGSMAETGARALGCPVIPAGTGQTELQLRVIEDLRPVAYTGTPSFLRILLEKGRELGADTSSFKRALVCGEAFAPELRHWLADAHGIEAYEAYATADIGLIAYESAGHAGLIADEAVLIEIVAPGTARPVAAGEVGEVVVTAFNPDYPLIRFATGDLSAALPGPSPCGRTAMRVRGWLGRVDQTTKVRGLFVHPEQIARVLARHPGSGRGRLIVEQRHGADRMVLRVEHPAPADAVAADLVASIRAITQLRGEVELVAPGSLPEDGVIIDDQRALAPNGPLGL